MHQLQPERIEPNRIDRVSYSIQEAAFALGVSPKTVRRLVEIGRLKSVKILRRVVIPLSEIERLIHLPKGE